ncbi:hypothetical protein [Saccharospirillum mangrovi]|uniref:hypothetical protein n=1 Tax=Saccharospirillum mangrovi TaxID=2161747 RepID=UPI000D3B82CD|nr:hypothetical protein [Saccharospirillum mangrovi]
MRLLSRLLLLIAILIVALVGTFWWLTDDDSAVPRTIIPLSDLRKYRQWLEDYHPARLVSGQTYRIEVSEADIQKLAILLASTQPRLAHSQFRAEVTPERLALDVWWPTGIWDRYLPLQLQWQPQQPFYLAQLSIAGVRLPAYLLERVNLRLAAVPSVSDAERLWRQLQPKVELTDGQMALEVVWDDPLLAGWMQRFAPFWSDPQQVEQLREEVLWLGDWLGQREDFRIPLRDAMQAMLARPDFDWDADAPAMLGALSYAALRSSSGLTPGEDLPELPFKRLTLQGRYDLARHFVLAMWLGTQMSPQSVLELAVYKEWSDALTRPTGFSAEDMVANVAGLEMLLWLQSLSDQERKEIGLLTDDSLMPPEAFWQPWMREGEVMTESQLRELVASTRAWLANSPLYQR